MDDETLAAFWSLVQDAGHLDCPGWSYDSRDGDVILCACGALIPLGVAA